MGSGPLGCLFFWLGLVSEPAKEGKRMVQEAFSLLTHSSGPQGCDIDAARDG